MSNPGDADATPITSVRQLADYFAAGCKPPSQFRIGTEHEKFGFRLADLRPPPYAPDGIGVLLEAMAAANGGEPILDKGSLIGLKLEGGASVSLEPAGQLFLDAGAVRALLGGKSLLPIGVTGVRGDFVRGDAVAILDPQGREIARGLVALDREEADLVKGKNSKVVGELLGLNARAELGHRDNLVVVMTSEARA